MIKVTLLGTGNVATHLFNAFDKATNIEVIQVYNRTQKGLSFFKDKTQTTTTLSKLIDADVYIIAIADDAIAKFCEKLPFKNKLVVHTSGSIAMDKLSNHNNSGVFYPLQTFTKGKEINFKNIPICIEATQKKDEILLLKIAAAISETNTLITSVQRKSLHIAAVFVNNFVNHLYQKASEICEEHNVSFNLLKPLILETAQKITDLSPLESQTGPAKRNDQKVIDAQHSYLEKERQQEIYKLLTQSIQDTHGNKL